jgi:SAM-dependent methyltransferase
MQLAARIPYQKFNEPLQLLVRYLLMSHVYSDDFYNYINKGSIRSAEVVSELLLGEIEINSILDVGCGQGAWLKVWQRAGVDSILGTDGEYIDTTRLLIDEADFSPRDLSQGFNFNRSFDLVQSLEVAEHIEEENAEAFISSIVKHGDIVLFSAATPGQGGENHVNEQPPEYWQKKFGAFGYRAFDFLRPRLAKNARVMPWYRYNSILYVNECGVQKLSDSIRASEVSIDTPLEVRGALLWRLRLFTVAFMPLWVSTGIARAKSKIETLFL